MRSLKTDELLFLAVLFPWLVRQGRADSGNNRLASLPIRSWGPGNPDAAEKGTKDGDGIAASSRV